MNENVNVPYQVATIIESMLNKRDNVHLRGNYRMRLAAIRDEIDKAIKKYDQEVMFTDASKDRKKRA